MDRGRHGDAASPREAKLVAGEAAVFCSERGVQIHGGYGFIKDYRAEKFYRDAKICTIGEGTSEIQRLVIARQLLGPRPAQGGDERPPARGTPVIPGIAHVGIAVRSIAEARRFWEALGLTVERVEEVPHEGVRVAMIPCGESRIELLEPTRDDSPIAAFLARRGPGIHHLCLASDDLRGDEGRLREGGFTLLREQPSGGAGGTRVQFVHPRSAGGVLVELAEEG